MGNIIEERDRNGIRITCSDAQWISHIALNHSIMTKNVDAVRETIVDPDYIFESHDSEPPLDERRIYTKEVTTATYHTKIPHTHVVVSICGGTGEVITAYPAKNPRSGSSKGDALYVAEGKPTI